MKNDTFCEQLATRIAEIRSALRERFSGLSRGEESSSSAGGSPQETLASFLEGIDRRLAELAGLCPVGTREAQGGDETARDALSRVLGEIGGRRGRGLLPDSLSWVSAGGA